MKEFVQGFRRAARGSRYEGRPLVEEFKRGINATIYQRLIVSRSLMVDSIVFSLFIFILLFISFSFSFFYF